MILILISAACIYGVLILFFCFGLFRVGKKQNQELQPISVIIAARNEEENLPELLQYLQQIDYPEDHYEIIIANDRSTDRTGEILEQASREIGNLSVVHLSAEFEDLVGKKGALAAAIAEARYDILAFTDADCLIPPDWLREIDLHFHPDVDFLAGYSPLLVKSPWLRLIKNLERSSIFAVTAGSFGLHWGITCTARNMAYRKSLYERNNGFEGIGHIRSGDDDLMLQKLSPSIRRFEFMFSENSIIPSIDKADMKSQINLESRRASKLRHYTSGIKLLSLFVFIFYILFISGIILFAMGRISLSEILLIITIKVIPEFLLLSLFTVRMKQFKQMLVFPIAELIYIPYFVFFGIKGSLGKYRWKN